MAKEGVSDDDLRKLLDAVSLKASKLPDNQFQNITGEPKMAESKQTSTNVNSVDALPISLKLQILSFLDQGSQSAALSSDSTKKELLPPVKFDHIDVSKLNFFSETDLKTLNTTGFFIKDNFLGNKDHVLKLSTEADELRSSGKLKLAGMGRGNEFWNDSKIRGDEIMWVNQWFKLMETQPNFYELLNKIDKLRFELNEACNFGSKETQTQITCYPGNGSRYVRHLDSFVGGSTRRLTFLYYINPNWKPEDGGCLRIYLEDGTHKDIEPLGDRLLVFQSRVLEHEVLPTNAKRYAVTMWFY